MQKKTLNVLVVGQGPEVKPVVEALGRTAGVGMAKQVRVLNAKVMSGCDVVVEMVGGVAPAFDVAMAALGQGLSVLTANPLLVAAHGRVLQGAAQGQHAYFGFQAAAFGLPLAEVLATLPLRRVTAGWHTAANMALARIGFRNETPVQVAAQLKLQQVDMSDWGGKVTQAKALAVRGLWQADTLPTARQARIGVERVDTADMRRLREFGLQMMFGAEITATHLYVGPLAVGPESPLLAAAQQDVLVGEGSFGEVVLSHAGDAVAGMVGGLLADVRQVVRSARPAAAAQGPRQERGDEARAYVRVPAEQREAVLACKPEILQERVSGDGLWQAVVQVKALADLQAAYEAGGMVYPLSGAWEPVSVGLRLVG